MFEDRRYYCAEAASSGTRRVLVAGRMFGGQSPAGGKAHQRGTQRRELGAIRYDLVDEVELSVFFSVGVAEFGLFVGEVDFAALDVGGVDECCGFEDVGIGDDEGGVFGECEVFVGPAVGGDDGTEDWGSGGGEMGDNVRSQWGIVLRHQKTRPTYAGFLRSFLVVFG
ncbi:MAG: hypothetical protein JKY43_05605 [Phycisphaerales bacterium]|nr:hypothetical protein [Phycisphaerales bacterium]